MNPQFVFQLKLKTDLVYLFCSSAKVFKIAMFFGPSTHDSARRWCQKTAKTRRFSLLFVQFYIKNGEICIKKQKANLFNLKSLKIYCFCHLQQNFLHVFYRLLINMTGMWWLRYMYSACNAWCTSSTSLSHLRCACRFSAVHLSLCQLFVSVRL